MNTINYFHKLTKDIEKEVSKKLRKHKYSHWIDAAQEKQKLINEKQREYIFSLNYNSLITCDGCEIFIDNEQKIMFFGYPGKGLYTVGYVYKTITKEPNQEKEKVYIAGIKNYHEKTECHSYFTPLIQKEDIVTDTDFINKLFSI